MTRRYNELDGQVALVTGGAKGIGRGIAERLAAEGMGVVVADLDAEALAEASDSIGKTGATILPVHVDISDSSEIDRLFAEAVAALGSVDLLVNNAADLQRKSVLDDHDDVLELQLAVNIRAPYVCSQRAAALMKESGGGNIVHISSVGGLRAHQLGLPYDVTKGAIDAMTRAMAIDLGPLGIRVNAVAPGVTFTYRTVGHTDNPKYREAINGIPLRRSGTVEDVGAAVSFLASSEASYITGQVIYVDGGLTAQLSPPRSARTGDPNDEMDLI